MSADDIAPRSNALLEAIYESAVNPGSWLVLREHMLKNFREDLVIASQTPGVLDGVLRHLRRALRLAERHEQAQWESRQLAKAIDALAPAVCVVDVEAAIVGCNHAAQQLLSSNGAGRLGAQWPQKAQSELHSLLGIAESEGYSSGSVVVAGTPARNQAWVLHVGKVAACPVPRYAVVIFSGEQAQEQAIAQFAKQYTLTGKETRVLRQMLRHSRLQNLAEAEDVSYHTARQHLQAVYRKTGANSQAELASALLRHHVIQEAKRTQNPDLLPHIRGLAHSHFTTVGESQAPRQLCYAEFGRPTGRPVLYFHSLNGSRLEIFLHDRLLHDHNIRLIAVDRPGYGHSDYCESLCARSYMLDVRRLLEHLNVDQIRVLSCSAGTVPALACGSWLGDRVTRIDCTGVVPPFEHIVASSSAVSLTTVQSSLFRVAPSLMRPALELMLRGQTVESIYEILQGHPSRLLRYSPRDIQFITDAANSEYFFAYSIEALRQGTKAWAKEATLINQDWGVPFDQIRCPVHFWHGDADLLVAPEMVRSFVREFPRGHLTLLRGETHLLIFRQLERILGCADAA